MSADPLPVPDAGGIAWLWPCNVRHWQAWQAVQTQWRYASGGMGAPVASGLCYAGVIAWLQANGYRSGRRGASLRAALDAITECERAALDTMAQRHRTASGGKP